MSSLRKNTFVLCFGVLFFFLSLTWDHFKPCGIISKQLTNPTIYLVPASLPSSLPAVSHPRWIIVYLSFGAVQSSECHGIWGLCHAEGILTRTAMRIHGLPLFQDVAFALTIGEMEKKQFEYSVLPCSPYCRRDWRSLAIIDRWIIDNDYSLLT